VPQDRWLSTREMEAWRAFLHAGIRVLDVLDDELAEQHQLTLADYEVISTLSEQPKGRLRMADLAARALVSRSCLSYRIDGLEARGLVTRQTDPTDRRGTFAVLTAAGRRLVERAAATHVAGVRRHFLDPLATSEQTCLARGLGAVLDRLDARPKPRVPPENDVRTTHGVTVDESAQRTTSRRRTLDP
jgi:DNA-binding MarR family transcriptional regulator